MAKGKTLINRIWVYGSVAGKAANRNAIRFICQLIYINITCSPKHLIVSGTFHAELGLTLNSG